MRSFQHLPVGAPAEQKPIFINLRPSARGIEYSGKFNEHNLSVSLIHYVHQKDYIFVVFLTLSVDGLCVKTIKYAAFNALVYKTLKTPPEPSNLGSIPVEGIKVQHGVATVEQVLKEREINAGEVGFSSL